MIFRGPHADVSAPKINVLEFVLGDISSHKDKTAIVQAETGRKISYHEISESINQLAKGLQVAGFKKGDVLAIYSPNLPEYVVVFLAVLKLGGVCTNVNPLYTADELAKRQTSTAKGLIGADEVARLVLFLVSPESGNITGEVISI